MPAKCDMSREDGDFGYAILMLVPNDASKPTYEFFVCGPWIIAQNLQEMKDKPDVEVTTAAA